jgi:two-component system, OmpR family, sensor kinase
MYQRAARAESTSLEEGLLSEFILDSAEATLRHGGAAALRALLRSDAKPFADFFVYAVDPGEKDILGRWLPRGSLASARRELVSGKDNVPVRAVVASDGTPWLLFVAEGTRGDESGLLLAATPGVARAASAVQRLESERRNRAPGLEPPRASPAPGYWLGVQIFVLALASLAFSAWLAWYMTRPIRTLRWAFDAAARGQLDTRVQPLMGNRRDEIADLGAAFDHMVLKVQSLVDSQRRLLHDVSHELRSPLARLGAATDLARQNPERRIRSLDQIDREAARLDQLVDQMLTLSRLEAGTDSEALVLLDLAELVDAIVYDARFEAQALGCEVRWQSPGELPVVLRAEMMQRACENIIRNALKFTAEGTAVDVTLARLRDGRSVRLEVADRGPGVEPEALESLFQPFARGPNSRGVDGFGLGLAIARNAARQHGGTIEARLREGGGLVIWMDLP